MAESGGRTPGAGISEEQLAQYAEMLEAMKYTNPEQYQQLVASLGGGAAPNRGAAQPESMLVHPTPAFVIKTRTLAVSNGDPGKKVFVNVTVSPDIACFSKRMTVGDDGKEQEGIHIPLSLGPRRDDVDRRGAACMVFDVAVHTAVVEDCDADPSGQFRSFVCSLALQYVERKYGGTAFPPWRLDGDFKLPKLRYKGRQPPPPHRIRKQQAPKVAEVPAAARSAAASRPSQLLAGTANQAVRRAGATGSGPATVQMEMRVVQEEGREAAEKIGQEVQQRAEAAAAADNPAATLAGGTSLLVGSGSGQTGAGAAQADAPRRAVIEEVSAEQARRAVEAGARRAPAAAGAAAAGAATAGLGDALLRPAARPAEISVAIQVTRGDAPAVAWEPEEWDLLPDASISRVEVVAMLNKTQPQFRSMALAAHRAGAVASSGKSGVSVLIAREQLTIDAAGHVPKTVSLPAAVATDGDSGPRVEFHADEGRIVVTLAAASLPTGGKPGPDPGSRPWLLAQAISGGADEQAEDRTGSAAGTASGGGGAAAAAAAASAAGGAGQALGPDGDDGGAWAEDRFLAADALSQHFLMQREQAKQQSLERQREKDEADRQAKAARQAEQQASAQRQAQQAEAAAVAASRAGLQGSLEAEDDLDLL